MDQIPPHATDEAPTRDIQGPNIPVAPPVRRAATTRQVRVEDDHSSQESLAGRLMRSVSGRKAVKRPVSGENPATEGLPQQEGELEAGEGTSGARRGLGRQRTLVRPERSRIAQDPNSPYYYTANRAAAMHAATRGQRGGLTSVPTTRRPPGEASGKKKAAKDDGEKRSWPSAWIMFSRCVTCYIPAWSLSRAGMHTPGQQQAWREKVALVTIIVIMCLAVGFLTFGFQQVLCGVQGNRIKGGPFIDRDYVVIHGKMYKIDKYRHPLVPGIDNSDLRAEPTNGGGKDLSFRF